MGKTNTADDRAMTSSYLVVRKGCAKSPPDVPTGICRVCHADIELPRLKANPAVSLCRDCAEEAELFANRLRRNGGH